MIFHQHRATPAEDCVTGVWPTFRKLSTLVQFLVSDYAIAFPSQWLERFLQRMILDISERKVDNAALVVSHQLVEVLDQVFLGGLFNSLLVGLCIRLSAGPYQPGPQESFGFGVRHSGS